MTERAPNDLYVDDTGSGEPALLLHSSGLSGRQWRRLASEIARRGMRAIVPDLSGHGRSPPWPEPRPFSFRTDVARVADLLRARGPAHVVGHSYGGFVALHAAREATAHVRSLTLFDPVAFGSLDAERDRDALDVLDRFDMAWGPREEEGERWLRGFVDFWGGPGAWAALRDDARAEFRRVGWVIREGVLSMRSDATPFADLVAIPCPLALVTGETSPLPARRVVERLADARRDARIDVIAGAGHLAPVTHAAAVNDVVLRAIAGP